MTENIENIENTENICKIEATGFQDLCNHFAEVEKENKQLIFENNKLKQELMDIKSLGMFEFAEKYCNDKQLADAGHAFARSLLGHRQTSDELAIEAAENCYVPYNGDDF